MRRVLVLGYGNPGREDDGLGPAAAAEIERMRLGHVTVQDSYQLVIEDAIAVAKADVVWFVDATRAGKGPFEIQTLSPAPHIEFTTHLVRPEVILALAELYWGKFPEAYLLSVRGYRFEFYEGLSEIAGKNLQLAVAELAGRIAGQQVAFQ